MIVVLKFSCAVVEWTVPEAASPDLHDRCLVQQHEVGTSSSPVLSDEGHSAEPSTGAGCGKVSNESWLCHVQLLCTLLQRQGKTKLEGTAYGTSPKFIFLLFNFLWFDTI